jgi:hypothetical protein
MQMPSQMRPNLRRQPVPNVFYETVAILRKRLTIHENRRAAVAPERRDRVISIVIILVHSFACHFPRLSALRCASSMRLYTGLEPIEVRRD